MKERAAEGGASISPPRLDDAPAAVPLNVREHLVNDHGYSQKRVDRMTDQECFNAHAVEHGWNQSQPQTKKQARRQARGPGLLQRIFGGEG
jgi:hypothetical protein